MRLTQNSNFMYYFKIRDKNMILIFKKNFFVETFYLLFND